MSLSLLPVLLKLGHSQQCNETLEDSRVVHGFRQLLGTSGCLHVSGDVEGLPGVLRIGNGNPVVYCLTGMMYPFSLAGRTSGHCWLRYPEQSGLGLPDRSTAVPR